jgi:hypothetical protein
MQSARLCLAAGSSSGGGENCDDDTPRTCSQTCSQTSGRLGPIGDYGNIVSVPWLEKETAGDGYGGQLSDSGSESWGSNPCSPAT